MKINFRVECGWFNGADFQLIGLDVLTWWLKDEHDVNLQLISITVLKFTLALWLYVDKENVK
jgi:hypothetical protein